MSRRPGPGRGTVSLGQSGGRGSHGGPTEDVSGNQPSAPRGRGRGRLRGRGRARGPQLARTGRGRGRGRPRLRHHPYQEDFIDGSIDTVVESGDEANNEGIFLNIVSTV